MNELERYGRYEAAMEDFWGRRAAQPSCSREGWVFGHPYQLLSNDEPLLAVVEHSQSYFSQAPELDRPPFVVQLVAAPSRLPPGPPPDSLFDLISYHGQGSWLMLHLGPWGQAHVDLAAKRAIVVLDLEMAAKPELVAHSVLNTILLNFCLESGYGLLHASCLVRENEALLLMAPHNSGKSTTALHLIRSGLRLLTDSMIHISPYHPGQLLCGFPVGTIKLRGDMLAHFPDFRHQLVTERVRDETKFALDLRRVDSGLVWEEALAPRNITLCLLARRDSAETEVAPASWAEVWGAVMHNSLFFDTAAVWQRNLAQITPLLERASAYHLRIGRDPGAIVRAVERLWPDQ